MARTVDKLVTAAISNLNVSVDANGEIVVKGDYKGIIVQQALQASFPCILFLDRSNGNVIMQPISDYNPNYEFIDIVAGIK